jgi:hypothetical protein
VKAGNTVCFFTTIAHADEGSTHPELAHHGTPFLLFLFVTLRFFSA